jgi:hypothetical protein
MRRAGLAALLALVTSACTTWHDDLWIDEEPMPETRAELYERFGPPDAIRRERGQRFLRYDYAEWKGLTLGARWQGIGILLSRRHKGGDTVWVEVDAEDRVQSVTPWRNSTNLSYRLWPFSD